MKKIVCMSLIFMFFNCKDKQAKISQKFTEKDVYEIANLFILQLKEKVKTDSDTIIYWNKRQLKSPPYAYTLIELDTIVTISEPPPSPFPKFTERNWKIDKLKNINPVDDEYYKLYLDSSANTKELLKLWKSKYNSNVFHNVSCPIYNSETKIAILKDKIFEPLTRCGTGKGNIYFYKKEKGKWYCLNLGANLK